MKYLVALMCELTPTEAHNKGSYIRIFKNENIWPPIVYGS